MIMMMDDTINVISVWPKNSMLQDYDEAKVRIPSKTQNSPVISCKIQRGAKIPIMHQNSLSSQHTMQISPNSPERNKLSCFIT